MTTFKVSEHPEVMCPMTDREVALCAALQERDAEIERITKAYVAELDTLSNRNYALRMENAELAALKPLSGIEKAAIGVKHFGNPIPQEWYAAAKDLEAIHGIKEQP